MKLPFELLGPGALGLLGLLVPLVVLYILKVRRSRMQVASTWLWLQAERDLLARSPFKRLIVQIPLILQALALVVLAVAAARPASRGPALTGDHVALVIDTSASMSTREDGGKRRIDLAKEAAHALVRALPPGSDAMLIDAGRDALVALPADRDTRRLHAAVDRLEARDVEGDVGASLALAVSRLKQQAGKRRVYVISDGYFAAGAELAAAVPVELVRVGRPRGNTAIVRAQVEIGTHPVLRRPEVRAFLVIGNYGPDSREIYVTMRQQNASDTLASRREVIAAGARAVVELSFSPAPGDYGTGLIFELSPHDDMPIDDVAYGRVPAGRQLPVILAADAPDGWLARAVAADPEVDLRSGTLAEVTAMKDLPHDAFVIVQGACPPNAPGGDLLVVDPPGGVCFGATVGKEVEGAEITSWSESDPRLRFVERVGRRYVQKARLCDAASKAQELLRTDLGVIAADASQSARYVTLLGFSPAQSAWVHDVTFVVFVRNLLEQARLHRSSGLVAAATTGQPLRIAMPLGTGALRLVMPGGGERDVRVKDGLAVVPDTERVGLYRAVWQKPRPGKLVIPVNLVSERESDMRVPYKPAGAKVAVSSGSAIADGHREHGWILALLALGLIVFDVWYLTRTPRRPRVVRPLPPSEAAE